MTGAASATESHIRLPATLGVASSGTDGIITRGMSMMADDEWLTIQEAAKLSGYHAEYLRIIVRAGKLTAHKFGPVWAISKKSLLSYLYAAERSKDQRHGPRPTKR